MAAYLLMKYEIETLIRDVIGCDEAIRKLSMKLSEEERIAVITELVFNSLNKKGA